MLRSPKVPRIDLIFKSHLYFVNERAKVVNMQKRLECAVTGRVQLVMFRDFVTRKARARGIVGDVRNNPDGSVSVVAEGEEQKLEELLLLVRRGSVLSRVDDVRVTWGAPLGEFKSFDILY